MAEKLYEYSLDTGEREMVDITATVREALRRSGMEDGICLVYCPHTTAGITINENADPAVKADLLFTLGRVFPDRPEFRHMEGNSAAHAQAACVGSGQSIPVRGGKLLLGRWQGIYFCEFDGPRSRKFTVSLQGE